MDIALLDADAKLVVSEKEKALLGKFLKITKFYILFQRFPCFLLFFFKNLKSKLRMHKSP